MDREQAIYDSFVEYMHGGRTAEELKNTLFNVLAIYAVGQTPEDKKAIAQTLEILK